MSEVINVLLLGETGIGKSTFINTVANYLQCDTLASASASAYSLASAPICLIPNRFAVSDNEFNVREVQYGLDDSNECYEDSDGQSVTQQCREYVVTYADHQIRLIDTPGIGDTRDVDRDKYTMRHIVQYLAQYDTLHAICLIVKPDMTRLSISFELCLRQLLSHLPSDAGANIVFVFTTGRVTCFRPRNTIVLLRELLRELREQPPHMNIPIGRDTMYCVDSDPFIVLMAMHNGLEFEEREIEDSGQSWTLAANECQRLFNFIITVMSEKPVSIQLMDSASDCTVVQQVIQELIEPIEALNKFIMDNIRQIKVIKRKSLAMLKSQDNLAMTWTCSFRQLMASMFAADGRNSSNNNNSRRTGQLPLRKRTLKCYDHCDDPHLNEIDHACRELELERDRIVRVLAQLRLFQVIKSSGTGTGAGAAHHGGDHLDTYRCYLDRQIGQAQLDDNDELVKFYNDRSDEYDRIMEQARTELETYQDSLDDKFTMNYVTSMVKNLYDLKESGDDIKYIHGKYL